MHLHIGFAEFVVFAMYFVILKAAWHLFNVEARRNGWHVPAGVSGLFC